METLARFGRPQQDEQDYGKIYLSALGIVIHYWTMEACFDNPCLTWLRTRHRLKHEPPWSNSFSPRERIAEGVRQGPTAPPKISYV